MHKNRLTQLTAGLFLATAAMAASAIEFQAVEGEVACPSGFAQVTSEIALNYRDRACRAIGNYGGAWLVDKKAMSGASGGCNVSNLPLPNVNAPATLCYSTSFQVADGDNSCPAGTRLVTVKEAAIFNTKACEALKSNQWYVARLANQGSIGGSAHNCVVKSEDAGAIKNSLCTK